MIANSSTVLTEGVTADGTQDHLQQLNHVVVGRGLGTGVQRPHLRRQRGVHYLRNAISTLPPLPHVSWQF